MLNEAEYPVVLVVSHIDGRTSLQIGRQLVALDFKDVDELIVTTGDHEYSSVSLDESDVDRAVRDILVDLELVDYRHRVCVYQDEQD